MARIFNPKEVIVTIGSHVVTGYADGTFIEVETSEDMHTLSVGSDGNGTFNINPNESGTVKLTLQHNSPSVNILSQMGLLGSVIPIVGMDNNEGGQQFFGNECVLQKQINFDRAKEVGQVEIVYLCEKLKVIPLELQS